MWIKASGDEKLKQTNNIHFFPDVLCFDVEASGTRMLLVQEPFQWWPQCGNFLWARQKKKKTKGKKTHLTGLLVQKRSHYFLLKSAQIALLGFRCIYTCLNRLKVVFWGLLFLSFFLFVLRVKISKAWKLSQPLWIF